MPINIQGASRGFIRHLDGGLRSRIGAPAAMACRDPLELM